MPSWLQNTGRVGPFSGGGWVHLTPVVAGHPHDKARDILKDMRQDQGKAEARQHNFEFNNETKAMTHTRI